MNRCPISYEPCGNDEYSERGLKLLSPSIKNLERLNFTNEELLHEAAYRAAKLSIQGNQPKLNMRLNVSKEKFEIVDSHGLFILKPQNISYPQLPENEDLTMRLAKAAGLEIPLHGLIYTKDASLVYFIKRFDRLSKNRKYSVEDFAQLAGRKRETKYDYSKEKLALLIDKYCTFPVIEKEKLFRLTIFNYITGNEDMHLKNYSIISREGKVQLSPAYDLINTTIAMKNPKEEIALSLNGKKNNLSRKDLVEYWGNEKLDLSKKVVQSVIEKIKGLFPLFSDLIEISFLSSEMKKKYLELLESRLRKLE